MKDRDKPADVIGVGIDFGMHNAPIDKGGVPCFHEEFKVNRIHVKLWKHHAAQDEANRIVKSPRPQGRISACTAGKYPPSGYCLTANLNEAPHIYEKADRFIGAADWIVLVDRK